MVDFDRVSIDDVDAACRALDAWDDAERRAARKARDAAKARGGPKPRRR